MDAPCQSTGRSMNEERALWVPMISLALSRSLPTLSLDHGPGRGRVQSETTPLFFVLL